MRSLIVIPSRYGSSRFPGKPLAMIAGKSLIERVWRIAKAVKGVDGVVIATDDPRIETHAKGFGAEVVITSSACRNGTERALEVVKTIGDKLDFVVNLQGDSVLTPPSVIEKLVLCMKQRNDVGFGTVGIGISAAQYAKLKDLRAEGDYSTTIVVADKNGRALYFSRALIPHYRDELAATNEPVAYKHLGLYSYTPSILEQYLTLEPTPLEMAESLEQLRALENGIPIHVVTVPSVGRTLWSIDLPSDVRRVEELLSIEGEVA